MAILMARFKLCAVISVTVRDCQTQRTTKPVRFLNAVSSQIWKAMRRVSFSQQRNTNGTNIDVTGLQQKMIAVVFQHFARGKLPRKKPDRPQPQLEQQPQLQKIPVWTIYKTAWGPLLVMQTSFHIGKGLIESVENFLIKWKEWP